MRPKPFMRQHIEMVKARIGWAAPMVRGRKGEHREVIEAIRKAGFARARIDGEVVDVYNPPAMVRQRAHTIEMVVDRVVIREGVEERLRSLINHIHSTIN